MSTATRAAEIATEVSERCQGNEHANCGGTVVVARSRRWTRVPCKCACHHPSCAECGRYDCAGDCAIALWKRDNATAPPAPRQPGAATTEGGE